MSKETTTKGIIKSISSFVSNIGKGICNGVSNSDITVKSKVSSVFIMKDGK